MKARDQALLTLLVDDESIAITHPIGIMTCLPRAGETEEEKNDVWGVGRIGRRSRDETTIAHNLECRGGTPRRGGSLLPLLVPEGGVIIGGTWVSCGDGTLWNSSVTC